MFLQRKVKLRWWTSHQLERRRSVWRHREVSCHRRRRCSFQKTSRSRRRSGSSPWPARSTNTRSSFWKAQEYFDLNNLQPVVLLHQLHGPWPRDLHTFKVNIIINSLAFDLCEHVGRGRFPRQDRLRAGLVHSWQGGQGPAANLNNWLRLRLRMVDMYDYAIGSSQVKYQKNLFRKFLW